MPLPLFSPQHFAGFVPGLTVKREGVDVSVHRGTFVLQ